MKYRRPSFDDPEDLGYPSYNAILLFNQVRFLDFAWRNAKRKGDPKSVRRFQEIQKILTHISKMQAEALRALVPKEIISEYFKQVRKNLD